MEESYANVPIGYLTVLLGNLCLNDAVRSKIRSRLPGRKLDLLVEKVKEFVTLHERVDRMTDQFEGDEGREVSQNYTRRLIQVVRRLEQANV
jgi:acyl carrier protein phosphodiesterase